MKNLKTTLSLILLFVVSVSAYAQKASPAATATGKIGEATVTISYSSPAVKERKIWGELVPYNKIWRAGANEATIFETDKALKIDGKDLPAGKYSIYMLPTESEWTIIFNSQVGQWGITRAGETTNDPTKDVLKVTVKPMKSKGFNERMTYEVNTKGFALNWENLTVPVKVK
ncbi:DUF2911 domain-containing protein [Pedobacter sp. LMG 31464]|uniref:DUF2911 domain-containing protein n=1 Tax=Pedobacter planticolens TaxID=2679964 RepID=A0A923ITF2_9SPHI|nr:DUF2911 domain-containing protein [Pedobacter planticolens]MBB2144690.1 DUF2911 domain-containing protein [Pedobacter planticolens]